MTLKIGVHFYHVSPDDWMSRAIFYYLKSRGLPNDLLHCAVRVNNLVTDITAKGIYTYGTDCDLYYREPALILETEVSAFTLETVVERWDVAVKLKTRLKYLDFILYTLGYTDVFLCTDFVQLLLGFHMTHLLPYELAAFLQDVGYVPVYQA